MNHKYTVKAISNMVASMDLYERYGAPTTSFMDLKIAIAFGERAVRGAIKELHEMFYLDINKDTKIIELDPETKEKVYNKKVINYLDYIISLNWALWYCCDGLYVKDELKSVYKIIEKEYAQVNQTSIEQGDINRDFGHLRFKWVD